MTSLSHSLSFCMRPHNVYICTCIYMSLCVCIYVLVCLFWTIWEQIPCTITSKYSSVYFLQKRVSSPKQGYSPMYSPHNPPSQGTSFDNHYSPICGHPHSPFLGCATCLLISGPGSHPGTHILHCPCASSVSPIWSSSLGFPCLSCPQLLWRVRAFHSVGCPWVSLMSLTTRLESCFVDKNTTEMRLCFSQRITWGWAGGTHDVSPSYNWWYLALRLYLLTSFTCLLILISITCHVGVYQVSVM